MSQCSEGALLLAILRAAGAELVRRDGVVKIERAHRVPAEEMAKLRAGRSALLEAWEAEQSAPRYLEVPEEEVPAQELRATAPQRRWVTEYVNRQASVDGPEGRLAQWWQARMARRGEEFLAALDLVCWQLRRGPAEAVAVVEGCAEAHREAGADERASRSVKVGEALNRQQPSSATRAQPQDFMSETKPETSPAPERCAEAHGSACRHCGSKEIRKAYAGMVNVCCHCGASWTKWDCVDAFAKPNTQAQPREHNPKTL